MKKSFWVFLILSAILVIFSVQNAAPVRVNILFNEVRVSLAILLIIVFLTGVIAGASYFFIKSKKKKEPIDDTPEYTEELSDTNADN
ncbi:LapA family protein [Carboxylicivirga sediminis]|uniref:LapA family protein n=1 Tax=Carboxylicivirga sediminis TaxID=2006564 RepID=A0A941FC57_9BACT|nr:LapA family protein [Carboxylicivirga sediminis]MBR8538264.1 LapA family protein [Carboxylicivirga sediminis]